MLSLRSVRTATVSRYGSAIIDLHHHHQSQNHQSQNHHTSSSSSSSSPSSSFSSSSSSVSSSFSSSSRSSSSSVSSSSSHPSSSSSSRSSHSTATTYYHHHQQQQQNSELPCLVCRGLLCYSSMPLSDGRGTTAPRASASFSQATAESMSRETLWRTSTGYVIGCNPAWRTGHLQPLTRRIDAAMLLHMHHHHYISCYDKRM